MCKKSIDNIRTIEEYLLYILESWIGKKMTKFCLVVSKAKYSSLLIKKLHSFVVFLNIKPVKICTKIY